MTNYSAQLFEKWLSIYFIRAF